MSVEREMSLAEWCAKLPNQHKVNQELAVLNKQLAALAEQNAKMRKALTKWRYPDSSYNLRCGHCGNEVGDGHKEGCALALPDLSTPAINRLKAAGMREAAEICDNEAGEYGTDSNEWCALRSIATYLQEQADELGKEA